MEDTKVNEGEVFFEALLGINFSKLDGPKIFESCEDTDNRECNIEKNDSNVTQINFSTRVDQLLKISDNELEDCILKPTNDTSRYDRLFTWASCKGAKLENIKCCEDFYGGTCLVTTINAKERSVIASLPRSLRIGQHTACKRLGIPRLSPDLSALSLFLLDVLLVGSDDDHCDNFYPYVACLPHRCVNALFMSEAEVSKWSNQGMDYETAISKVQSQGESCMRYIQDCLSSNKSNSPYTIRRRRSLALWWAVSMVQSRSHGFGTTKSRWLTPVFDFCNHSTTPNCTVEGNSYGELVLKTTRDIAAGEELTIDYMEIDDAKLVATYGFSNLQ